MLAVSLPGMSQKILLEEDVKSDTVVPAYGPNLKKFRQAFFAFGFPLNLDGTGSSVNFGSSNEFTVGMRSKYKLCSHNAAGYEIWFNRQRFSLSQDAFPDSLRNIRELYKIGSLGGAVYDRVNFGRRGNVLGKYLDLGAWGNWHMRKRHEIRNENEEGEKVDMVTTGLKAMENFSFGLMARAGWGMAALKFSYRLSDHFNDDRAEFPRLSVGLEIALPSK